MASSSDADPAFEPLLSREHSLLALLRVAGRPVEWCFEEDSETVTASLLPLLPCGRRLALDVLPAGDEDVGTGGRVWHSAPVLCRWLRTVAPSTVAGADVLELGCGTGACGLFALALGARSVVLTDGGPRELLELAARNLRRNRAALPAGGGAGSCRIRRLAWGESPPEAEGPFDLILGSDVIYNPQAHAALCVTLRAAMLRSRRLGRRPRAILSSMPRRRVPLPPTPPSCAGGVGEGVGEGGAASPGGGEPASAAAYSEAALVAFEETAAAHGMRVVSLAVEGDRAGSGADVGRLDGSDAPRVSWSASGFREASPFLVEVVVLD